MIPPQDLDHFMNFSSDTWPAVLETLMQAADAWRTPAEIAADLGWDPDRTTDILADLHVAGLVEVWERCDDVTVAITDRGRRALSGRRVSSLVMA
jgi:DNA-binding MarR family transcriptional regulator